MSEPHDAPTIAQLVEAVREWIERDVMTDADGRKKFHARVAANALSIVERELALGESQKEQHRARLARLGFEDDAALARAIRGGAMDSRWDEVTASVRDAVREKLEVANPKYVEQPLQ